MAGTLSWAFQFWNPRSRQSFTLNVYLNWVALIKIHLKAFSKATLACINCQFPRKQTLMNSAVTNKATDHWFMVLWLVLLNNLAGLTPFTFTATSHLSFSVRIALISSYNWHNYKYWSGQMLSRNTRVQSLLDSRVFSLLGFKFVGKNLSRSQS